MKKSAKTILLCSFLTLIGISKSYSQDDKNRFILGAYGGYSLNSIGFDFVDYYVPGPSLGLNFSYKPGKHIAIQLGYEYNFFPMDYASLYAKDYYGTEYYLYRNYLGGDANIHNVTLGGKFNFLSKHRVQPYLIINAGVSIISRTAIVAEDLFDDPIIFEDQFSETDFTFGAGLGVDFLIGNRVSLFLQTKAQVINSIVFDDGAIGYMPVQLGVNVRF